MTCLKICIKDYTKSLQPEEKICLAKCSDRAYEYLKLSE